MISPIKHSYKELFDRLPDAEPSAALAPAILARIERSRTRSARLHVGIHAVLLLSAFVAFVPAINSLMVDATRSGFSEYISLVLSDGGAVLGSWKSFALTLMETAPVIEAGIIVALALICANSLRRGARYARAMMTHPFGIFA